MLLDVNNINVYYGAIRAIKGISFHVDEGEIVTLIGANGAGKTTTLQTGSGLLHSKTGSIECLGEDISHVPAHRIVERGNDVYRHTQFRHARQRDAAGAVVGEGLCDLLRHGRRHNHHRTVHDRL